MYRYPIIVTLCLFSFVACGSAEDGAENNGVENSSFTGSNQGAQGSQLQDSSEEGDSSGFSPRNTAEERAQGIRVSYEGAGHDFADENAEPLIVYNDSDLGMNPLEIGSGRVSSGSVLQDSCETISIPGYWNSVNGLTEIDCHGDECFRSFVKLKFANCQSGAYVFPPAQKVSTPENIFQRETGDYCVDNQKVWEASSFTLYPNAGGLNNIRNCPEGTTCQNGACVGEPISCREFIPGHNDPTKRRINLIFVGSDYHLINSRDLQAGMDAFLWDMDVILGENSSSGLFDVAPFQNLKDKFNIWYVDHFSVMEPVVEPYTFAAHQQRNVRGKENAALLMAECIREQQLNDAYTYLVHLVPNKGTLDSSITISTFRTVQLFEESKFQSCQQSLRNAINLMPDYDRDGCLTIDDYPDWQLVDYEALGTFDYRSSVDYDRDGKVNTVEDQRLFRQLVKISGRMDICKNQSDFQSTIENLCATGIDNLGRSLAHGETLAHEIGHTLGMFDISSTKPAATHDPVLDKLSIANCFIADSEKSCRDNAPWKDLIGNGCGEQGVEDCDPNDLYYSHEITCVEGCLPGVKSYRSTRGGTYTYGTALNGTGILYHADGQVFSEWDAWYLKQLLENSF